jgi:hypothetical protein
MVQTSTAITACDAGIWLADEAGVQKDISGSSNQVTMNFDNELGMFRTFGSRWPRRLECGKDAAFALQTIYTTAADEGYDLLKNWFFANPSGSRLLTIYLPKKNVGADVYEGLFKLDNYTVPANAGSAEPVIATMNVLPDGEVTLAVNAT